MTSVALAERSASRGLRSTRTTTERSGAKKKNSSIGEVPILCCGTATLLLAVMGDPKQDYILPKEHRGISRIDAMKLIVDSFDLTEAEVEKLISLRKQINSAPKVNSILSQKMKS